MSPPSRPPVAGRTDATGRADTADALDAADAADADGTDGTDGTADAAGAGDTGVGDPAAPLPVVAILGRPNVGKSTLVNRIIGRREAVVEDTPGVTRDRVAYDTDWAGHDFVLLDTGGWDPDATGMAARIAAQAEVAAGLADAVILVVDATVGVTEADSAVVRVLRRVGVPVVLAANKVDDPRGEADAAALWALGLGEPWPVSAMHGRGVGDLLDAVLAVLPEQPRSADGPAADRPPAVALLGRPNVGKSSLLNTLAGSERVVVDDVAGTTVDPVDELVVLRDRTWLFIDTAGLRRRVREASGTEYYASLRTNAAVERADVALVLLDASAGVSEQDLRLVSAVTEAGRALVVVFTKWDLVDEDRRLDLDRQIDREFVRIRWAQRVNISGLTGWHVDRLVPALDAALAGWSTRVPTGRLNSFLSALVAAHPHPVRGGKQAKILFATQAATRPPTFVLFTSGPLDEAYTRFVERRLREDFGFAGSPVRITVRVRAKRAVRR